MKAYLKKSKINQKIKSARAAMNPMNTIESAALKKIASKPGKAWCWLVGSLFVACCCLFAAAAAAATNSHATTNTIVACLLHACCIGRPSVFVGRWTKRRREGSQGHSAREGTRDAGAVHSTGEAREDVQQKKKRKQQQQQQQQQ
jgi:hypothetical protein